MAFLFKSPAPIGKKKRRSPGNLRLLNMLERYITDTEAVPISILTKFWADQAASITYKEIRKMIEDGDVSKEDLENWSKDYSILVEEKLAPLWEEAIIVGQIGNMILDSLKNSDFEFDPSDEGIRKWIEQRGADFVTNSVQEQKKAIRRLTAKAVREELSPDELSRVIRPCIGLNSRQAEANLRYYNNIKAQLRKEHPKMKQETIVRRARDKALKSLFKRLMHSIGKNLGFNDEEIDSFSEPAADGNVQKGNSQTFGDKMTEVKRQKVADEIWSICYALQSSLQSILYDEDLEREKAKEMMEQSISEFDEIIAESVESWSNGKLCGIRKSLDDSELESMRKFRDKLDSDIQKAMEKQRGELEDMPLIG